jgi:hypothetical protein
MELDELKNLWRAEDKNLDNKIKLNEKLLMKMNMEKATGEVDKIIETSMAGRNMALVYCFISTGMAIFMIDAIAYSIPAMLGGLAMLWSFISHLSIKKFDYENPIVQIQKEICTFRVHTAATAKYDMLVVALWMLTIVPVILKVVFNMSVYNDHKGLAVFYFIASIPLMIIIVLSRKLYAENDRSLKKAESYLAELIEFETNSLS